MRTAVFKHQQYPPVDEAPHNAGDVQKKVSQRSHYESGGQGKEIPLSQHQDEDEVL